MSAQMGKDVAVVDDDLRILESLEELLESAGYHVRLHSSASSLLASGVSNLDCLITDISMPGMDGFELSARVKQLRPDLPVFLISGGPDLTQHEHVDDPVGANFFGKPFDGAALLTAIGKALHGANG